MEESSNADRKRPKPYVLAGVKDWKPETKIKLKVAENPIPDGTLGDLGLAVNIQGQSEFPLTILIQPFDTDNIIGIDTKKIRVFRWDKKAKSLLPIWNSGINTQLKFIWSKIERPGLYIPLGLPRDRLVQEAVRSMAQERKFLDSNSKNYEKLTRDSMKLFLESPVKALEELRRYFTRAEVHTSSEPISPRDVMVGEGGHFLTFPLPRNKSIEEFKKILTRLKTPATGLPEESLFYPPEQIQNNEPPWAISPKVRPWDGFDYRPIAKNSIVRAAPDIIQWFISKNWWMYQHDRRHTGHASGMSDIRSTNVNNMVLESQVSVEGLVLTKPSIVNGKVYVGTATSYGLTGTLYKIDLATGNIDGSFPVQGDSFYSFDGIGGSPAIVSGKVYFTTLHGKVYRLNASTMTATSPHPSPIWVTDLRNPDPLHKQPILSPNLDCWSGPLVVNGKVYVGCGEGEDPDTYGFVFCLNADTGDVIWLYCTCKFTNRHAPGSENNPNVVPASVAAPWAESAGYTIYDDSVVASRETGCSVWSSCAYDAVLNRINVGTGNSQYKDDVVTSTDLPEEWYGSGLISLDADTGELRGYHQPIPDDSYWPHDFDIDVSGSPTIVRIGGRRVIAYGSKNGSFFLLDPETLVPIARRQLIARQGGTGLPGNRGTALADIVPESVENTWGVMGTPAIHWGLNRLFVCLGGRADIANLPSGYGKTPFIRALDSSLNDAWPTFIDSDNISKYSTTKPPMYLTRESGLSSPAIVNDVVFVSTDKMALYALDANTGLCLWSAPGLPAGTGWPDYSLGPALYGNYVVVGAGEKVFIYKLHPSSPPWWWHYLFVWRWIEPEPPWPDPGSLRSPDELVTE
jgi:outer membrane protein assembly factor BamB